MFPEKEMRLLKDAVMRKGSTVPEREVRPKAYNLTTTTALMKGALFKCECDYKHYEEEWEGLV